MLGCISHLLEKGLLRTCVVGPEPTLPVSTPLRASEVCTTDSLEAPENVSLHRQIVLAPKETTTSEPWDFLFDLAEVALTDCFRTALLFYLLAMLHLVCRTLRLQRSSPCRNAAVRRGGALLRGAPVLCALWCVAHLLPFAEAVKRSADGCAKHEVSDEPVVLRVVAGTKTQALSMLIWHVPQVLKQRVLFKVMALRCCGAQIPVSACCL